MATTLDGKIATQSGESKWITGELSRKFSHKLRACHDAVLVGSGTVVADNPSLICRLPGFQNKHKLRIIVDGRLRTPLNGKLAQTAKEIPVLIYTHSKNKKQKIKKLESLGVKIVVLEKNGKHLDIKELMKEISSLGITRLLIEGGGVLNSSLMANDLVDEIAWFRSPCILGNDGVPAIENLGLDKLEKRKKFSRNSTIALDEDILEILIRN
ncbi:MAG: RibD family protein [Pseudomonadota bacterium]|nr:RibD family protein [Pseudomonadota bacterium]